ncbi:MAG TPA: ABC transporter substrate-binding protein [Chloroflexota bacterium]|nr:ABC transporter substrate-binding protein [Chloroflexota bacterium]
MSVCLNRRSFLRLSVGVASVSLLAACGGGAAPASTAPSSAPAAASKPAAPASASAKPAASGSPAASGAPASKPAASPASASASVVAAPGTQLVRIATVGSISDAGFYIADDRGYMKEVGLTPDYQVLNTGPQMVPLLATGQLDVAGGSVSGALFSAIQRDIPLRIVADKGSNRPNFVFASIELRKDLVNEVKGFADLKGRQVAISATDNSGQYLVNKVLKSVNLTLKDVDIQTVGYTDQGPAFANKAIDAGQEIEPFATNWIGKDLAVKMPDQGNVYNNFQAAVLMYGPKFVQDKPDVGKNLMVAYLKGVRDYNLAFTKGTDKETVIQSLLKHTTVKDRALYDKMGLPGLNPDGTPIEEDIAAQQDFYVAMGYQKEKLDLKPILDHQFVDYAISQIGKFNG